MKKEHPRIFYCLGGIHDGHWITAAVAERDGYTQYNCSVRTTRRFGFPPRTKCPSSIMVCNASVEDCTSDERSDA